MKAPRVTVLMSVHNGGRWLRPAIDSILAQTFRDFEFLIIDDASTDDSAAQMSAIADPRIRLIRLPSNIGLTASLNLGLREAQGEIVARQDADDLSSPDRLAAQVAFLDAHPEVIVLGAQGTVIDAEGRRKRRLRMPVTVEGVRFLRLLDNPVIHSSVALRGRQISEKFGGYDETFVTCQDYDLWTRVMERGAVVNLGAELIAIREHGGSISATRRDVGLQMVRRVVERIAPREGLTADEVGLAVAYRRHLRPDELPDFRRLLDRWFSRFAMSADVRSSAAQVLARVGYNLLSSSRLAAVSEIAAAIRLSPELAKDLPWFRMIALLFLGRHCAKLGRFLGKL